MPDCFRQFNEKAHCIAPAQDITEMEAVDDTAFPDPMVGV